MSSDAVNLFTTYNKVIYQSQAATPYARAASTINTSRLGAKLVRTTESGWFAGSIGEFMIIKGTIVQTLRQKIEGYSAHKWGVAANLPPGHPYLSNPP